MFTAESDLRDAATFWVSVIAGIICCVLIGHLAVTLASEWFIAICLALGGAVLTFYEPKIGLGLLVFSMLLSPRLRGGAISGVETQGSSLEIRLDDILLPIIVAAWFGRTAILKGETFLIRTPLHAPMFFYTFVCILSTGLAMMRGSIPVLRPMFFVLKYFEFFLLYFMAVNVVKDKQDIQRYLIAGWIVAIIVTLFGYAQIPSGQRISTPFETPIGLTSAAKIIKGNESNTYGGYCLVVFGMLLAYFTQGSSYVSLLSMSTFLFMLPPFFLTLSRSSYIGLVVMVLLLLGITLRKRWQLALGLSAVFIAIFSVPRIRDPVLDRVFYTFTAKENVTEGGISDQEISEIEHGKLEASAKARVNSWKALARVWFPRHPFLGSGVTAVGLVDVQIPRVLGEVGIIGLAMFLWLLFNAGRLGWEVFKFGDDLHERALGLGFIVVVIGLLFQSSGANTFIIVRIAEPFWFLAALCARLDYNHRRRLEGPTE